MNAAAESVEPVEEVEAAKERLFLPCPRLPAAGMAAAAAQGAVGMAAEAAKEHLFLPCPRLPAAGMAAAAAQGAIEMAAEAAKERLSLLCPRLPAAGMAAAAAQGAVGMAAEAAKEHLFLPCPRLPAAGMGAAAAQGAVEMESPYLSKRTYDAPPPLRPPCPVRRCPPCDAVPTLSRGSQGGQRVARPVMAFPVGLPSVRAWMVLPSKEVKTWESRHGSQDKRWTRVRLGKPLGGT